MRMYVVLTIGCILALAAATQAAQRAAKRTPVQRHHHQPSVNPQHDESRDHHTHVHDREARHEKHLTNQHVERVADPHLNRQQHGQLNRGSAHHPSHHVAAPTNIQSVQEIRAQHVNFHAKPSSSVTSMQFNEQHRVKGAEHWHGLHYEAFRSYRPEFHDRWWWHAHHPHIIFISGGWYYWNAGYWYPAWGYDPAAAYYPYDGPIYVGASAKPADQVIADVQAILQQQGYYHGEVDGLLGPRTREALATFQRDNALASTATLDQPTLQLLGLI